MTVMEGTDGSSGQVTQAKSSYIPQEILWGHRFITILKYDDLREEFEVDFSKFDTVVPISTPLCSAAYSKDYTNMQKSRISSNVKLNFTPRQSIGEIPLNTLMKLREKHTKINILENDEKILDQRL